MTTNTGGPAFPSHGSMGEVAHEGMTLRDYFAGQALTAILSNCERLSSGEPALPYKTAADEAIFYADAMLAALEAKQ